MFRWGCRLFFWMVVLTDGGRTRVRPYIGNQTFRWAAAIFWMVVLTDGGRTRVHCCPNKKLTFGHK